jgi:parallel beta-helix repeat protein
LYSNVTLKDNIFKNNEIGVFLNYAYTKDYGKTSWNIVKDNIFQQNSDGLYVHWSENNEITGNLFYDNDDDGVEMESSRYSLLENNVFKENGKYGLYLRAASHKNIITNNDFIDNKYHAYFDGSLQNKWYRNYWSDSYWVVFKPIRGQFDIYDIPWINFDFFPAISPFHPTFC